MNRVCALLGVLIMLGVAGLRAEVPDHTVGERAVRLKGVGPDNPIVYDNDWWFDVFDNNYLWAQTSLGRAKLRGNIVSRDMWDWQKGTSTHSSNRGRTRRRRWRSLANQD
jgi:hypothetical protein